MLGQDHPRYNSGLCKGPDGRWRVMCRDGTQTYYYRAVVEADVGRHLRSDEIVHHINGDPSDDRRENLQVVTRAEHVQLHHAERAAA
jgi:hypothetical protein